MLDWTRVQAALTRAGYPCGKVDGQPGPRTWTALFACAAGRQPDATLTAIGGAGAAWLTEDAIGQTPQRLAEFIAQTAHETGSYQAFEEGFGYSVDALMATWPARFPTRASATKVFGRPKLVAEAVYGSRMGNTHLGDGYRYRGRGMLQLTGRANYAFYGPLVELPLVDDPDLAADPADSLVIAREFWRREAVNGFVDRGDFAGARHATNGGAIGLADVAARRARLLAIVA